MGFMLEIFRQVAMWRVDNELRKPEIQKSKRLVFDPRCDEGEILIEKLKVYFPRYRRISNTVHGSRREGYSLKH
jgi:hypothetical protein